MYLTLYFCHVFVSRENGTKIILLLDFKYGFSMVKTDYIASEGHSRRESQDTQRGNINAVRRNAVGTQ